MKIPAEFDQQLRKFIEANMPQKNQVIVQSGNTVVAPDPRTVPEGISVIIKANTETKLFKKIGNTLYQVTMTPV